MKTIKERFEIKFIRDVNDCWIWIASSNGRYGKTYKANRVAWELYKKEDPKNLHVLHTCDISLCVNPDHLFLGTHQDNMKDMLLKDRNNCGIGEKQHLSKLTEKEVKEIRKKYKGEWGEQPILAKEYKVTQATIYYIVNNKTWKHLL